MRRFSLRPLLEGGGREVGQQLVLVDPERRLHEHAVERHLVHDVGHAEAEAGHRPGRVGVREDAVAERDAPRLRPLRLVAVHELREVELVLVLVPRRVRALHLAQLALEAGVHHPVRLGGGELADVAVVLLVDEVEQDREAVAVLEAHAAAVADLEGPRDLLLQARGVPVARLLGVVGKPVGRLVGNRLVGLAHGVGDPGAARAGDGGERRGRTGAAGRPPAA